MRVSSLNSAYFCKLPKEGYSERYGVCFGGEWRTGNPWVMKSRMRYGRLRRLNRRDCLRFGER